MSATAANRAGDSRPRHALPDGDPYGYRPRFSVVIPAYNEAEFLGSCLDSLACQDFAGLVEIIVVDNNSTDGTAELARSRGVTVVQEARPGVCLARQRGTLLAAGEIVVSTDADTVYSSCWLSRIDRAFREDPARVAVAGPCRFVNPPWWGRIYACTLFSLVSLLTRLTGRVLYCTATNIAFRKSAWPGYDTQATQGGDEIDLLRRLRSRGTVAYVPGNPTFTSARRMHRGLAYNIAVTFLFYYVLGYALNRLAGRPVVGMAPAFRDGGRTGRPRRLAQGLVSAGIWLALCIVVSDAAVHLAGRWQ